MIVESSGALKTGPQITVELKNGDRIEGQFEELSPSELLLRTGSAQAAIPRADIERITTHQHDGWKNGTLIGSGIGAGIGLGIVVAAGGWGGEDFGAFAWGYSLIGAGVRALVGLGINVMKTEVVLYQTP